MLNICNFYRSRCKLHQLGNGLLLTFRLPIRRHFQHKKYENELCLQIFLLILTWSCCCSCDFSPIRTPLLPEVNLTEVVAVLLLLKGDRRVNIDKGLPEPPSVMARLRGRNEVPVLVFEEPSPNNPEPDWTGSGILNWIKIK